MASCMSNLSYYYSSSPFCLFVCLIIYLFVFTYNGFKLESVVYVNCILAHVVDLIDLLLWLPFVFSVLDLFPIPHQTIINLYWQFFFPRMAMEVITEYLFLCTWRSLPLDLCIVPIHEWLHNEPHLPG